MAGDSGMRAASGMWARAEVRRRPFALVSLGLLAGLAAAVALAAIAGARRTDDAFARFRTATDAADAVVFASQVDVVDPDWSEVAALPYVEAAGAFGLPAVSVVDGPKSVDVETSGVFDVAFGDWRTDVDRPLLVAGRQPDPANPHEVLVTEAYSDGAHVGDSFVLQRPSEDQIVAGDLWSPPEGDRIEVHVVGIGKSQFETSIIPDDGTDGIGLVATPAFHEKYGSDITYVNNLLVRFKPGQADVGRLESDVRRILDTPEMPILDAVAVSKRVTNGTALETGGLLLFGLAVALAGIALVGQALTRSVRSGADDLDALRALGATRRDLARTLALPHVLPVLIAPIAGALGAVALSPLLPIGLGRQIDPDVGVHADWTVLLIGATAVAALLALSVVVTAWREAGRRGEVASARRSRTVATLTRLGAPVVAVAGAQLALEPGRGRRSLPTRPALAGAAVGVLGVVGAFTLASGMDDATANPERIGSTWDVEVTFNDPSGLQQMTTAFASVDERDDVAASVQVDRGLVVIDGLTQPTYSIEHRKGLLDFTPLDGRAPVTDGEVALGPDTARTYGVQVGDTVTANVSDGAGDGAGDGDGDGAGAGAGDGADEGAGAVRERAVRELRVVGIVLLPTTPHSSYDQGALVTSDQLYDLFGADSVDYESLDLSGPDSFTSLPPVIPALFVATADDADVDEVARQLDSELQPGLTAAASTRPIDLVNLGNVRSLPVVFAVFTILLAIGTLAHVSASVVRRRAGDLAVLRVLGLTPRQTRSTLSWQATTVALIGLVIGLPLGLLLGQMTWRWVAESTPMLYVAPFGLLAVLVVVPTWLVVANLLALWPGRRAARLRPAEVLRRE